MCAIQPPLCSRRCCRRFLRGSRRRHSRRVPGRRRGYRAGGDRVRRWPSGIGWCRRWRRRATGVEAAAVVAITYGVAHGRLRRGYTVVEALEAVDRFHKQVPGSKSATICRLALDFTSGEFQYWHCAGHPPPLLVTGWTRVRGMSNHRRGPPRQRNRISARSSAQHRRRDPLYIDGSIERPGRPSRPALPNLPT